MNNKYDKCTKQWNEIFVKEQPKVVTNSSTGNETLDKGIHWVCEGTKKILDFGCGSGTLLLICALNGTKVNIGIDLSEKGVESAKKRSEGITTGQFSFLQGGIDKLKEIEDETLDAVILSNIIDNLYPEDGQILMEEVKRILKKKGKVLVKLNPYITEEQIKQYDIKVIKDNLLDDGLYLWNNTTEQWQKFFERFFKVIHYKDIYYPQYEQYNRMFWLIK